MHGGPEPPRSYLEGRRDELGIVHHDASCCSTNGRKNSHTLEVGVGEIDVAPPRIHFGGSVSVGDEAGRNSRMATGCGRAIATKSHRPSS